MFKNLNLIGVILFIIVLSFSSCRKDNNSITGTVTYIAWLSGTEYIADGANVYLIQNNKIVDQTTTDGNGDYIFSLVYQGNYTVEAKTTVNLLEYNGATSLLALNRKDYLTEDIVLK